MILRYRKAICYPKSNGRLVYDSDMKKYGLSEYEKKETAN